MVDANIKNAYTLLFMMPGVPSIYYGSEWGIKGEKGNDAKADEPVRPALELKQFAGTNPELIEHIKKLVQLRKTSEAVRRGDYKEILVKNEQLVFARESGKNNVIVCLNLAPKREMVRFQYKAYPKKCKLYQIYFFDDKYRIHVI